MNLTKKNTKGPSTFQTFLVLNLTNKYPFYLTPISVLFLTPNVMLWLWVQPLQEGQGTYFKPGPGKGNRCWCCSTCRLGTAPSWTWERTGTGRQTSRSSLQNISYSRSEFFFSLSNSSYRKLRNVSLFFHDFFLSSSSDPQSHKNKAQKIKSKIYSPPLLQNSTSYSQHQVSNNKTRRKLFNINFLS